MNIGDACTPYNIPSLQNYLNFMQSCFRKAQTLRVSHWILRDPLSALPCLSMWSNAQKHLRWTIVGPDSSYSCLDIHICWNVLSEDKMEPPIHTEYFRSGGATTLIFIVDGASAVSSLVMRSPMPVNIVVPPERTTFAYRYLRMSTSHFMIDWNVVS